MTVQTAEMSEGTSPQFVILASVLGAILGFAALILLAMSLNGWSYEYPLDDVYIHLAIAEQITNGGYGINPGEYVSASSSPIYPYLLTPFAETAVQRWLPLVWNLAFVSVAAGLLGYVFSEAGYGRLAVALGAAAPISLAMCTTAYTGMENMGHGAASMAIVVGLWRYVKSDQVTWLLIAGVFLAPAFRLEGLALAMAAGGTVAITGRWCTGAGLMALGLLPVVALALYLTSLGLEPLPNSVTAKLDAQGGGDGLAGHAQKFAYNIQQPGGGLLFILCTLVAALGAAVSLRDRRIGLFGLAVAAAGFAHLVIGSIGWMNRYENYILIANTAALAILLSHSERSIKSIAMLAVIVGGFVTYVPMFANIYIWNVKAIAHQQGEMSRFAKDFVQAPIAVNDIGYVSWRNPDPVLDLWGLASAEILEMRKQPQPQGWGGPLVQEHGVRLVMIYDDWLQDAVAPEWRKLGELWLDNVPAAFLGDQVVAFYAPNADDVPDLVNLLRLWEVDLPESARFEYEATVE